MAGKGPPPKPASMRQRRNKKSGAKTLSAPAVESESKPKAPSLQNPDKRKFHRLTRAWWRRVWQSPMASEYLPTDVDGLARLAILVDEYYKDPNQKILSEIRLQEARFGLSPIDRSRLQWEVQKGEEAERRRRRPQLQPEGTVGNDPRLLLGVLNGGKKK